MNVLHRTIDISCLRGRGWNIWRLIQHRNNVETRYLCERFTSQYRGQGLLRNNDSRGVIPNDRQPLIKHTGQPCSSLISRRQLLINSVCQRGLTCSVVLRGKATQGSGNGQGTRSTLYYIIAVGVLALGLSYSAVPLYRIFCQAYSYGGTTQAGHDADRVGSMEKVQNRVIRVHFNADIGASMAWNFKPQQTEIKVHPGETALAFYTARNPTDKPVVGISTYNVVPFEAGQYFNKIQCFCFEEQQLNPNEEVSMPVFFYIDPEFAEDPKMEYIDIITLSYTFFEARKGLKLPVPQFSR